ncbi:hypothetical protein BJ508DRAFT_356821 [Ascobolus immersus RN42]|uniref:F-box domain-containing protein n=1 Tax=Ascobolus immersus RN42 TaxID=1160509 RepID=A0A3N4IQ42_ASCIM|nr:hypothetical protein BJ508DRAFT_356821 [Ascobolus immersus RN42]
MHNILTLPYEIRLAIYHQSTALSLLLLSHTCRQTYIEINTNPQTYLHAPDCVVRNFDKYDDIFEVEDSQGEFLATVQAEKLPRVLLPSVRLKLCIGLIENVKEHRDRHLFQGPNLCKLFKNVYCCVGCGMVDNDWNYMPLYFRVLFNFTKQSSEQTLAGKKVMEQMELPFQWEGAICDICLSDEHFGKIGKNEKIDYKSFQYYWPRYIKDCLCGFCVLFEGADLGHVKLEVRRRFR